MKNLMMFAALIAAGCAAQTTTQQTPGDTDAGVEPVDSADPEPGEPCEPGAFLGCTDNIAKRCAADGITITEEPCDSGCNAGAERCNECVPNAATCEGDAVQTCGADGLVASTESCSLGCTEDGATARCAHIIPEFLPTVCDAPATVPSLAFPAGQQNTLDTDVNASCTGGIVPQVSGLTVCVVRAGTIAVDGPLRIIGSRAVAFVADGALDVDNIIDVAARGSLSGPGGGQRTAGVQPGKAGGGGAGAKQVGGNGGSGGEFDNGNGSGGAVHDPLSAPTFDGGAKAGSAPANAVHYRPRGGGGGGALMLVSCTGTVRMAGTIEAGGGGGQAGGDGLITAGISLLGGAGGGAGGYAVLQGATVTVSGLLFAGGGGGGGGCSGNGCKGANGEDSIRARARGGAGVASAGVGGAGGFGATAPNGGAAGGSPGGGGGSVGRFQIFTPAGVTPVITGTAQPAFEPNQIVPTR